MAVVRVMLAGISSDLFGSFAGSCQMNPALCGEERFTKVEMGWTSSVHRKLCSTQDIIHICGVGAHLFKATVHMCAIRQRKLALTSRLGERCLTFLRENVGCRRRREKLNVGQAVEI